MNHGTLRHDKHILQFRNAEQRLSGEFSRAATVKSAFSSPRRALHNEDFVEVAPDFRPVSPIPRSRPAASGLTMYITIGAESVTTLRRIVIGMFGEMVAFMRIQSIDHARKMKVCLCLTAPIADRVMAAIMHTLPSAEFGRITHS
jgi:hypothetical protein